MYQNEARKRREKIAEKLADGQLLLSFGGNDELGVVGIPQREKADKNFYYLTGMSIAEGLLMLVKSHGALQEYLFVKRRTANEVFYLGRSLDPAYYRERTGIQAVMYMDDFEDVLGTIATWMKLDKIYFCSSFDGFTKYTRYENILADRITRAYPGVQIGSLSKELDFMRLRKSELETEQIQKAIDITQEALAEAAKQLKPGIRGYQMQSILEHEIKMRGGSGDIVQALIGKETTIMHNFYANEATAKDGDLFLADIATFFNDYCCDISRTYPVNGVFTDEQAHWYNVVLKTQEMTIASMRPGKTAQECGQEANAYFTEELRKGGYLKDGETIGTLIREFRINYVTPGMVNHGIGLSCHEERGDEEGKLVPGMIVAIEPGVYFGDKDLGIRIEDDVLITETDCEVLSSNIPKTVSEIEALMKR